jgi:hypothetical protein
VDDRGRALIHRWATASVAVVLVAATVLAALVIAGRVSLAPAPSPEAARVFYVVPYHYGFAFYDDRFHEVDTITVTVGKSVTLRIVPAHALPRDIFVAYNERTMALKIGELAPGDPRIRAKIAEDLELGNVEHIIGIAAHAARVTTHVAPILDGKRFRDGGPRTLEDAARRGDPSIVSVTLTAKAVGAFDVLCIDSGMDGEGTCGWGHKWMIARGAFVVTP